MCYFDANSLKQTSSNRIVAFSIAEGGAMGEPGALLILTDAKEVYKTNFLVYQSAGRVVNRFGFIRHALDNLCTLEQTPCGWAHIYLGAGNHLFVLDWMKILFDKKVACNTPESELYGIWIKVITEIIGELVAKQKFEDRENCPDICVFPHGKQEQADDGKTIRKLLTVSWDRKNARKEKVLAIGINPSDAEEGVSDNTVIRLCRLLNSYRFDNVTMLNLFEIVSSKQDKIKDNITKYETDFNTKRDLLEQADIILLIWGVTASQYRESNARIHGLCGEIILYQKSNRQFARSSEQIMV